MQIMQDPIEFEICGIYHLNLQTLAGVTYQHFSYQQDLSKNNLNPKKVFFFMLEALVIFMQFVSLIKPATNG